MLYYPTGRIPSLPDPRNEDFRIAKLPRMLRGRADAAELRPMYRGYKQRKTLRLLWRGRQAGPFCVGFSGEGWARSTPSLQGKSNLGWDGYYRGAQEYDEWPGVGYEGSSVHGLMKFLVAHPANDVQSYRWARTTGEILDWLAPAEATPVVIGIDWTSRMWTPNRASGILDCSGPIDGGHALLIIGWWFSAGELFFLLHNSWGAEWGIEGRAWIRERDLQEKLDAPGGEAAVASKVPRER
jgi:hypothetical protein